MDQSPPQLPPESSSPVEQPAPIEQPTAVVPAPDRLQAEARTWAMVCHLSALSGFIGIPFGHIIGPLVIWLIKKDQFPLVDDQGKEALNFQISMTIYGIVAAVLTFVVIGFPLLIGLALTDIVLSILAAIEANKGLLYRYPITIRLIK